MYYFWELHISGLGQGPQNSQFYHPAPKVWYTANLVKIDHAVNETESIIFESYQQLPMDRNDSCDLNSVQFPCHFTLDS